MYMHIYTHLFYIQVNRRFAVDREFVDIDPFPAEPAEPPPAEVVSASAAQTPPSTLWGPFEMPLSPFGVPLAPFGRPLGSLRLALGSPWADIGFF